MVINYTKKIQRVNLVIIVIYNSFKEYRIPVTIR